MNQKVQLFHCETTKNFVGDIYICVFVFVMSSGIKVNLYMYPLGMYPHSVCGQNSTVLILC